MLLTHSIRLFLSKQFTLPLYVGKIDFIRMLLGVLLRRIKVSLGLYDPLTQLAAQYKSDKGVTVFPFHGYSVHYAKLLERFKDRSINILEIGLARRTDRQGIGITCPSLSMWLEYFPKANVYGLDIDDFSSVDLPRTQIFRGDQGNPKDLLKIVEQCPQFDIIIDDGSHASYHQQVSLKTLFPFVASNGLYFIEDLLFIPNDLEATLPSCPKTIDLLKNFSSNNQIINGIKEILFFESPLQKGKEELAVILKN